MNKLPWMKYDPDIISLDIDGMSLEEEGAYSRAVRHIWRNGALPRERVARLCGSAFDAVLQCMEERDGLLSFTWLEEARGAAKAWVNQRSLAGKSSAEKRTTVQRPFNDRSTVVLSPSISPSSSSEKERAKKSDGTPFDAWWKLYAKGSRKLSAEQWDKMPEADRIDCIAKTPAYIASKPDPVYRKDGERFLKHRTWDDPIVTPVSAQAPRGTGGMTREEAEAEMTAIRIANGRDPIMGRVDDEECSRALLVYRGVIKEPKPARA